MRRRGLAWWLALATVVLTACVAAAFLALPGSMASLQSASAAQQVAGREITFATTAEDDVLRW